MRNFFRKYFRRDNRRFLMSVFSTLFGFIFTNVSLVAINDFLNPLSIGLSIVCILFFVAFMLVLYHKYKYYRGLVEHLQQKGKHLFLICSYISKARRRRDKNKVNNFSVRDMEVAYDIDFCEDKECRTDFTVTYRITATNNGAKCTKIYHSSLSQGNGDSLDAKYSFDGRNWYDLRADSFFRADNNFQLWSATTDGEVIAHNQTFTYWVRFVYREGYNLKKDSCFLIDPQNYAETVERIKVTVRSETEELGKLIKTPMITAYHNGLNIDEKEGRALLARNFDAYYKTCFSHTVRPRTNDTIYVFELSPKQVD